MQMVQEPEIQRGYEEARRKVVEALCNLNFARVLSIGWQTSTAKTAQAGTIFQGEVMEVFSGRHSKASARQAYFSKYTRNETGVNVMGCFNLVDSPMGPTHASSTPQVGDILVGNFTPALQRGKLPFEFKHWCNNGKPLLELVRILQFGSRMSKGELHTLLRQPASVTANFALRLQGASLKAHEKAEAQRAAGAQDDIWLLARALCFCELEPDDKLKLSKPHYQILSQLAMTTLDETMLEDLQKHMPAPEEEKPFQNPFDGYPPSHFQSFAGPYSYGQPQGSKTPEFQPSSPVQGSPVQGNPGNKTPPFFSPPSPKSPPYAPSSPKYQPSSPQPPYAKPRSPPYRPQSIEPGEVNELAKLPTFTDVPQTTTVGTSVLSRLLGQIDKSTLQAQLSPPKPLVSYEDI